MFGVQPDINHTSSRRDTECCKLRGRPRAIPPGFQADSCQTCGLAFFACAFEACTNESAAETDCKSSIWGSEREEATARCRYRLRLKSMLHQSIQLEFSQMPKENDLEGRQDMGGKHGGQAGMPKPENGSSAQQGILRDEKGQEQPADKERAQHVSRKDRGNDPPGDPKQR